MTVQRESLTAKNYSEVKVPELKYPYNVANVPRIRETAVNIVII
ncbi:MAG TPA: hypothetical protein VJC17_01770 [Candidatus Dojkabacteria bacterium]|nr:hypothetical protein [Candidatus Dojkabacteria bacterium]